MALSVKQILERFKRGQSLPQTKDPIFTEEDYSEIERMDTFEKMDLLSQTNEFIQETQENLQNPPESEKTVTTTASEPASEPKEETKS